MTIETKSAAPKRLLHILHNGPFEPHVHAIGGVELHVQDLIRHVSDFEHWSLVALEQQYLLTCHRTDSCEASYLNRADTLLTEIFERFDLVHLHHARGFNLTELAETLEAHPSCVASLHDFFLVCPRTNLLTPHMRLCSGHECTSACGYPSAGIANLRENTRRLLLHAARVFVFSDSTKNLYFNILTQDLAVSRMAHALGARTSDAERSGFADEAPPRPGPESPFKILLLGHIAPHKGSGLLESLALTHRTCNGVPIEWHLLGQFHGNREGLIEHGDYNREDVTRRIREVNPHLCCIMAACPETYSMTADEAWNAGVPLIVSPFGAPAERVRRTGAGWVLPVFDESAFMDTIAVILYNWAEYWLARRAAARVALLSGEDLGREYSKQYREVLARARKPPIAPATQPTKENTW